MNPLFAVGLFDNPWIVAVIVIGGALANWIAKRRQEKEAGQQPESEAPPLPDKPQGELNLEEALRRLLGQESPPQQPVPPPIIPRTPPPRPPAQPDWQEEEYVRSEQEWMEELQGSRTGEGETTRPTPPPLRSTPTAPARPLAASILPSDEQAQAAGRFAQLNEAGRHPATVVHAGGGHSVAGTRTAHWRNPRNVRQAFVASLVFGPPKGLEP